MRTTSTWVVANAVHSTKSFCNTPKSLASLAKSARLFVVIMVLMVWGQGVWGANRYSVAIGNWNSTSTWSDAAGGASGFSVPVAGDVVYIQNGKNVTVTADAAAASITFTGAAATLTVNSGFTLTVSGAVILLHNVVNPTACSITGGGTLSCASVDAGSNLSLDGSYSAIMTSTLSAFTISGDVTMIAKGSGSNYGQAGFRVEDGTTTVGGQVTSSIATGCVAALRMNGVTTGLQTGTLVLGGATPWGTLTNVTVVLNGTSSTVVYNCNGAQPVLNRTYTNLTLAGSGNKTMAGFTINGKLSIQGTAAAITTSPVFGANSTLEYKGSSAQLTTNIEFPTTSGPKNLIIDNTNGVTLHAARTISGTTTVNNGCTFATNATFTNSGTATINGVFQLNSGGWATGTACVYGATSTLVFNSAAYGVNNDVYWPTSNSPYNVTALQTITMNVARSVSGTFQTSAGVTNANNLTFNGIVKLNTGGFLNTSAPTYGSSSTLIYNTGGTFGRGFEWNSTSGAGYPANIQISNNTTLNYPNGSNAAKSISGNLTIDAGSSLFMDYGSPAINNPLTIGGNLANYGSLSLGDAVGGDLKIYGNIIDNGNFYANNRAIFFNGGNTQVIQGTGVFDISYVRINKSGGSVQLATNLTCEGPGGGNAMEIDGAASVLDLNGFTLYLGKTGVASTYNSGIASPGVIKGSATSSISILGTGALGTLNFVQTSPGTSNALQNLTINRTSTGTVTLGNALVVAGTLNLTDGALSGSLTYGANGILTYNGTSYSTTSDVEFPASSGPKDVNITVANASGISLHANRTLAGNMTIASVQKFIVPASKQLTVSGTFTNSAGASGLVIESGASLKHSTVGVTATVNRNIPVWGSALVGWHLLSSPVASQGFQPNFVSSPPSSNEDFYMWDETTNYWINSKSGAVAPYTFNSALGTTFGVGQGYLVSYGTNPDKVFSGTLNVADVVQPISYTEAGRKGWNLLGNPFACGLKWNVTTWGASNIGGVAKIIKSTDGSYQDINADDFIPAMNGFFVNATQATSITIPASAKEHSGTWLKSDEIQHFALVARDLDGETAQSSNIRINPESTAGFDLLYDGVFAPFYAPQFYSIAGTNKLSTNSLPDITEETVIPMGFIKNDGNNFRIEAQGIETITPSTVVYLWDNKLGIKQNLSDNPVYEFTSALGDEATRFALHFKNTTSIPESSAKETFSIIQSNGSINIVTEQTANAEIRITNMLGQVVLRSKTNGNSNTTINTNHLQNGVYIVSLVSGGKVASGKFVK
jgi:hypothetical protein